MDYQLTNRTQPLVSSYEVRIGIKMRPFMSLAAAVSAPLLRKPWLAILAVLGIALGASVVVAIDLAATSARAAQRDALAAQHGRATHRVVAGPAGVPEADYVRIVRNFPQLAASPVIEITVALPALEERRVLLMGIDTLQPPVGRRLPVADATRVSAALTLFATPQTVMMSAELQAELRGVHEGDPARAGGREFVNIRHSGVPQKFQVAGTWPSGGDSASTALLVMDIATAQELTARYGRLSYIDLANVAAVDLGKLRATLSPGSNLVATATLAAEQRSLSQAFETNLQMMGLVALLVGLLLVYNTVTFTVIQRREQFGVLRCLGAQRRQIFGAILLETAVIAVVAALLGVLFGYVLASTLLGLVAQTLNDLYFAVSATDVKLSAAVLAKGAATAIIGALAAALVPAWEACNAPPTRAMRRSAVEVDAQRRAPRLAAIGAILTLAASALLFLPPMFSLPFASLLQSLELAFGALFLAVVGVVLTIPWCLSRALPALANLVRARWPTTAFAVDGVRASSSRTAVAVAALTVALAATIGVGVMIDSFRGSVAAWLQVALQADIYVSRPGAGPRATVPPAVEQALHADPRVRAMSKGRSAKVASSVGPVDLIGLHLLHESRPGFVLLDTARRSAAVVWAAFAEGGLLVTEPFANRHGVAAGDSLRLQTERGWQDFAIAAIYRDYGRERGVVVMDLDAYRHHFADSGVSTLGLYLRPDADVATTYAALRPLVEAAGLRVQPTRAIREASLRIFDRTFAITQVLRAVTVVVAFVGVLSALMALQLERARELAILRATGATRAQAAYSVVAQTATMGLASGLLAMPLGVFIGYILVTVVNTRSFGWSLDFDVDATIGLQALALAVMAAGLAGLYPAWRLSRRPLGPALRNE